MKILVIRFSSVGDIVLTEPVVRYLKQVYPASEIDYLTKPQYSELLDFFPTEVNVITGRDFREVKTALNGYTYDLIIDLHGKLLSKLVSFVTRSNAKTCYHKNHLQRRLTILKLTRKQLPHTVHQYLNVVQRLGFDFSFSEISPQLKVKTELYESEYLAQVQSLEHNGTKTIAVFPGALHKTKQYPIEYLARFINSFSDEKKYRFFLLGTESEKNLATELQGLCTNGVENWSGKLSLGELVRLIESFSLIVSNDSGPMHIAAALRKKQIAIFGATHPMLGFSPMNDNAIIIEKELPCRPCSLHGGEKCPKQHFRCMLELYPETLIEGFETLIKQE